MEKVGHWQEHRNATPSWVVKKRGWSLLVQTFEWGPWALVLDEVCYALIISQRVCVKETSLKMWDIGVSNLILFTGNGLITRYMHKLLMADALECDKAIQWHELEE
uniref:Uncharacterized protein n=1 Tax=Ananas comosus var. bracteatus TaxID=296719 RepID=A0A6V7P641_ANACO|nr:unnamed protein product [Ananas comosus var. bracteatus]